MRIKWRVLRGRSPADIIVDMSNKSKGSVPGLNEPIIVPKTGDTETVPGEPADKQVVIRITQSMKDYWVRAAEANGVSLSEFIREAVQASSRDVLECDHPAGFRQVYPWSETCLQCGTRLRDGENVLVETSTGTK